MSSASTARIPVHRVVWSDARGRMLLPLAVRKQLGLKAGDSFVLTAEDSGELRLISTRKQLEKLSGAFAQIAPTSRRAGES